MPATIREQDIADMLTTTLAKMGTGRFWQIAQELQEFEVMGNILTKRGGVKVIDSGIAVEETLMTAFGGRSRWVGLFEDDVYDFKDVLKKIRVEWCYLNDNMMFERRMTLMNRGKARVNNVIKPQKMAMMLRVAHTLEDAFFDDYDESAVLKMWGLKYWIVKNSSAGFNGGSPNADGLRIAGLLLSTAPTFKNYTFTYTAVTKADFAKKLRKAHRKTGWKSPVNIKQFRGDFGERRVLYVNEATISNIEDIGESQNENLGRDFAPYDDTMVFRKHPIRWAVKLDSDTSNPVYLLDKATIHPIVLKGDYMRQSDVYPLRGKKHNVFVSDIDHTMNTICINRRANAVGYVA